MHFVYSVEKDTPVAGDIVGRSPNTLLATELSIFFFYFEKLRSSHLIMEPSVTIL